MRTREAVVDPLVNLSDLAEIELRILKRMRDLTRGDHSSVFHGTGFDFVGLRDWQPGDRLSAIDWPQSTITNFSPMIVRDYEQPSTAAVVPVADASLSTRCGAERTLIATVIANAIGIIGISAVFFQDMFGLITFTPGARGADFTSWRLQAVRPRIGKGQVIHCLDAYQHQQGLLDVKQSVSLAESIGGFMRKTSLVPVISDFLFENPDDVIGELARLNSSHDVFLVLIDSAFAFEMPPLASGWVEAFDVETGSARIMSRRALAGLAKRTRAFQERVHKLAKDADLDVLRLGTGEVENLVALGEFVGERRLRKPSGLGK